MIYRREEVEQILQNLGCVFENGSDDGCGFRWRVGNPGQEHYFDYDVPARVLVEELIAAGLAPRDTNDPDGFLQDLLP